LTPNHGDDDQSKLNGKYINPVYTSFSSGAVFVTKYCQTTPDLLYEYFSEIIDKVDKIL
jgi:hypothetical protein